MPAGHDPRTIPVEMAGDKSDASHYRRTNCTQTVAAKHDISEKPFSTKSTQIKSEKPRGGGGGGCIDTYFQVQLIADWRSQVACKPRPAFDGQRSDANEAGNGRCVADVDQRVSAAAEWGSKQPKSVAF